MPFGAPEGDSQVQAMLQVVLNAFHFGMDIQDAIDAPRFITQSFPSSFAPYRHFPGLLVLEDRIPGTTGEALGALGHRVERYEAYSRKMASVEAIYRDAPAGFVRAGADPRQPAYAHAI